MRSFLAFFALIVVTLAAATVLAWPGYSLLAPHFDVRFHRVASRIWMLLLLAGFVLVARRLGVADRGSLGYGLPRRDFLRELLVALGLGVLTMTPIVWAMFALGLRELRPNWPCTVRRSSRCSRKASRPGSRWRWWRRPSCVARCTAACSASPAPSRPCC